MSSGTKYPNILFHLKFGGNLCGKFLIHYNALRTGKHPSEESELPSPSLCHFDLEDEKAAYCVSEAELRCSRMWERHIKGEARCEHVIEGFTSERVRLRDRCLRDSILICVAGQ